MLIDCWWWLLTSYNGLILAVDNSYWLLFNWSIHLERGAGGARWSSVQFLLSSEWLITGRWAGGNNTCHCHPTNLNSGNWTWGKGDNSRPQRWHLLSKTFEPFLLNPGTLSIWWAWTTSRNKTIFRFVSWTQTTELRSQTHLQYLIPASWSMTTCCGWV